MLYGCLMKQEVCVVTGANSGVGFATARKLAEAGATVVLACRNRQRGDAARSKIARRVPAAELHVAAADLARLNEVRAMGGEIATSFSQVHLLVNNAGLYRARRQLTEDGFEFTFAVNHLAHFLLTHLLLASLLEGSGRVVNVSSEGHRSAALTRAPLEDIIRGRGPYRAFRTYGDSKLANILFTAELARRYDRNRLCATAVHPGVLSTRIWNRNSDPASIFMQFFKPFMRGPAAGGDAVVQAARQPRDTAHGKYFEKKKPSEPSRSARDQQLARELWELSSRLVGVGV